MEDFFFVSVAEPIRDRSYYIVPNMLGTMLGTTKCIRLQPRKLRSVFFKQFFGLYAINIEFLIYWKAHFLPIGKQPGGSIECNATSCIAAEHDIAGDLNLVQESRISLRHPRM